MRWTSLYFGFMAGVLGFAASVSWVAEAPMAVPLGLLGAAAISLTAMAIKARRDPKLLLVGRTRAEPMYPVAGAIDEAGYAVVTCPGPENRTCPVLEGEPCPVTADLLGGIAIVFHGTTPPCERALGIPVVAIDEVNATRARDAVAAVTRRK